MTTIEPGDVFEDAKGQTVTVESIKDGAVHYTTSVGTTGKLDTFSFIRTVLLNCKRAGKAG